WDPGPAWNKFFQTEGKATNGYYGNWGNYSVFDADAVLHPLYHTEPGGWVGKWYTKGEGLDRLIDEGRSTLDQPRRNWTYSRTPRAVREASRVVHDSAGPRPAHRRRPPPLGPAETQADLLADPAADPGRGAGR